MKKYLVLGFALLALSARLPAQSSVNAKLSAAASNCNTTNVCLILPTPNFGGVTFTVSANASSNTLQFEASADFGVLGVTTPSWVSLNATPSNGTTAASSTTSTGTWQANISAYRAVRIRMSSLVSGTSTVTISTSPIAARAGGGSSGGVTSVSGTTNQIDVATGTTTPVVSLDSAIQLPGTLTSATNGALSAPAISLTGTPITGGTGTTTVPLYYYNAGTSPSTWNTNGTLLGFNAPSGFTGNFVDLHLNGGASGFLISSGFVTTSFGGFVASSGGYTAPTNGSFSFNANGGFANVSNGVQKLVNTAGTGYTRLSIGPDTTSFPSVCPITGTVPYLALVVGGGVGGANCTTLSFQKTAQTLQVTGSDFTCTTGCTSLATITGLSVALPSIATNWSFDCNLIVSQATAAATDQVGVQTATNAPTNLAATGTVYTAAAVSTSASIVAVSSTSSQSVVTFTPGATGTNLPIHLAGTVEGTSTSGTTLNIQILTGSSSDAITIRRGSACWIY